MFSHQIIGFHGNNETLTLMPETKPIFRDIK
jgi:hypothetical protein